jgi:hypothetical protein
MPGGGEGSQEVPGVQDSSRNAHPPYPRLQETAWWAALVDSGHYGDQATPNLRKWGVQVVAWVLCVVSARR